MSSLEWMKCSEWCNNRVHILTGYRCFRTNDLICEFCREKHKETCIWCIEKEMGEKSA